MCVKDGLTARDIVFLVLEIEVRLGVGNLGNQ